MLGLPVAKQLQADGFNVRIICRDIIKAKQLLGADFEYRQADIFDIPALTIALQGIEAVHINLSGNSDKTYYKNHVIGTKNILAALGTTQVACISMISVATADPEYSDRADNRYKLEAEELLKNSGQPYLAFRPSWFLESLPLFIQKQKIMHIGPSTKPIHWIAAADYAQVVSNSISDAKTRNQSVTLYGPQSIKMSDAIAQYAQHHKLPVQKVPAWLAKLLGRLIRDNTLIDIADLMQHYDKTGEKEVPSAVRTTMTLNQWLKAS